MTTTHAFARTALALTLMLSVAAGCDSGSSGSASEEDRVKQTFDDWQNDFAAGDGQATCAQLTESGRKEVLAYGEIAGNIDPDASCEEVISSIVKATKKAGVKQQPSKAISAQVNGNKAIAQVSDDGRPPVPVRLIKENDDWKLPTAGFKSLIDSRKGN